MRISVERIHINRQGYDRRGTYWGVGDPLFYSSTVAEAGGYPSENFARARSAKAARDMFAMRLKGIATRQAARAQGQMGNMGETLGPLDTTRGLGGSPAEHQRNYLQALEFIRGATKNLERELAYAADPENGSACSDAYDQAESLIRNQAAAYTEFFAANPEADEMPPTPEQKEAKRILKNFQAQCLVKKTRAPMSPAPEMEEASPWYRRMFRRG
jgi:hypothetical protein